MTATSPPGDVRLRYGEPVELVRPWNGHSRGIVTADLGNAVRVAFEGRDQRFTRLFPRTAVMTAPEMRARREHEVAHDRELQASRVRFITLSPLWAGLMWLGVKINETRSWPTKYRGWLGIHAGGTITAEHRALVKREPFRSVLAARGFTLETLPTYAVVVVARQYDCVSATAAALGWRNEPYERAFGHYIPGHYAWLLHQHRVLPTPIPAKGRLGFWDSDSLPAAINVALGEELLPTTNTGRQAYYRGVVSPARRIETP